VAAATFRLDHRLGEYNAVQKVFYWGVFALIAIMLTSGLAIWKPVQFSWLTTLYGGFDFARIVHFVGMSLLAIFLLVHLALVALVPHTLIAMITGEAREHAAPVGGSNRLVPPKEDLP
jgi:thiosulfate reductase cytochrome b subunit